MSNPSEYSLGKEILLAQASGLPKRYAEDPIYRAVKLERYSRQIEDFGTPLRPSSLTGHALQNDWALRRLRHATYSSTLPAKDIMYLGDAAIDIFSKMTVLSLITTIDGVLDPWAKLFELEKQGRLSRHGAEAVLDITSPIRNELQQGGDDSRLIDLLYQTSLRYRQTAEQDPAAAEREALIYLAYRNLYPVSIQFLAQRRSNSRPIVLPSNWF